MAPTSANQWQSCLDRLEGDLPAQQFNTWIRPLQARDEGDGLCLLAPNRFVRDWVQKNFLPTIQTRWNELTGQGADSIALNVGSSAVRKKKPAPKPAAAISSVQTDAVELESNLRPEFQFDSFVEGRSNQIARAAGLQVACNPGGVYNPLFIYGGTGLGKTHLLHAIGHELERQQPGAKVVYERSEPWVQTMIHSLRHNTIEQFKATYRNVNALLIDDIQFFAKKERSQEEFFHTFNALLDSDQQIIMTCDRYAKEIEGLDDRLKSRFGWGLTVAIDPPDLETRVAILHTKAESMGIDLPEEVAFFVGQNLRSNVRELEGALKRIKAGMHLSGPKLSVSNVRDALSALLNVHARMVTIENIQKTVANYFKIRLADLSAAKRSRSIARPRQIAMALAKELTSHSLPEIGEQFGGRDHTTVLHACRKIKELRASDSRIREDYANLLRTLTT